LFEALDNSLSDQRCTHTDFLVHKISRVDQHELNIINMRLYRQGYIDRYASAYNGSIRPIRNHFKPGQYVLTVNAVTNKLDPRWTEPLCVVHYSPKRGYKLRHLGGMAAPLLDRRYPHSILKFAANQAEAKRRMKKRLLFTPLPTVKKEILQYTPSPASHVLFPPSQSKSLYSQKT
jgi:hypothetical protein